ncbi:MAG TPA: hypothetical protein VN442_21860 [Bryobacteraceae bacterium]|nr:hypothetical protein [Bryobacteraceae bacterium]
MPEVKTRLWALAAREASVSQKAMRRVQKIAKQNRDLVFQILHGSSIKAAEQELREETYDAQAEQALREYPEGGNIHTGDMGLLNDLVPDATADMVMTDPVYGDVQLYGRVAELAQRKLKVGGLCACYVGHRNKRLIQREMKKYLDEHVEVLVLHSGACTRLYELEGLLQVQVHPALRETPEASESYTPLDS